MRTIVFFEIWRRNPRSHTTVHTQVNPIRRNNINDCFCFASLQCVCARDASISIAKYTKPTTSQNNGPTVFLKRCFTKQKKNEKTDYFCFEKTKKYRATNASILIRHGRYEKWWRVSEKKTQNKSWWYRSGKQRLKIRQNIMGFWSFFFLFSLVFHRSVLFITSPALTRTPLPLILLSLPSILRYANPYRFRSRALNTSSLFY